MFKYFVIFLFAGSFSVAVAQNPLTYFGFDRSFAKPLDAFSVWTNEAELFLYATNSPKAYPGQILTLVSGGETVTLYVLDENNYPQLYSGEGGGGSGSGFPLTNDVSAGGFAISNLTTVTADSFMGDGSGVTNVDAETLDGVDLTDIVLRSGSQSITGNFEITGSLTSESFIGQGSGIFIGSPIEVADTTVGSYSDGMTIATGTPLETIIRNMLTTRIPYEYQEPTLFISANPSPGSYEVGYIPNTAGNSVILTPTWDERDAGSVTNYRVFRGGTLLTSVNNANPGNFSDTNIIFEPSTSYAYSYTVYYEAGRTNALDNLGQPSPENPIPAGSKTRSVNYNVLRRAYAGADSVDATPYTNTAQVRALSVSSLVNGTAQLMVSAPAGTKKVVFSYPYTEGPLVSATANSQGQVFDVTGTFASSLNTNIFVGGVSDYSPVRYRTYHWIPDIAPKDTVVFTLKVP